MTMSHWLTPITALAPRFASATDTARHALVDARDVAGRELDRGWHAVRDLSTDAAAGSVRFGRSARSLVSQRPVESVLLVAGAAFAIGWLAGHLRRARKPSPAATRATPARAAAKSRATKR
jgi:hypothetical protein